MLRVRVHFPDPFVLVLGTNRVVLLEEMVFGTNRSLFSLPFAPTPCLEPLVASVFACTYKPPARKQPHHLLSFLGSHQPEPPLKEAGHRLSAQGLESLGWHVDLLVAAGTF